MAGIDHAAGAAPERSPLDKTDVSRLVADNADFVWRSVRRLGVPESLADDATQQVFVVLMSKVETILPGRERAFLFGVAMNVASHVRRSLARRREVAESASFEVVDASPLPDAALDRRRARALLDLVLDELELDLRTIFVMAELEEMSMADIADVLQLPAGTAASRLRRAREEFKKSAQRIRARNEHPRGPRRAASFAPPLPEEVALPSGGLR